MNVKEKIRNQVTADTVVLADPEIRDGIKVYSNWPTIPQLSSGALTMLTY